MFESLQLIIKSLLLSKKNNIKSCKIPPDLSLYHLFFIPPTFPEHVSLPYAYTHSYKLKVSSPPPSSTLSSSCPATYMPNYELPRMGPHCARGLVWGRIPYVTSPTNCPPGGGLPLINLPLPNSPPPSLYAFENSRWFKRSNVQYLIALFDGSRVETAVG